jgi:hypothetical protein
MLAPFLLSTNYSSTNNSKRGAICRQTTQHQHLDTSHINSTEQQTLSQTSTS